MTSLHWLILILFYSASILNGLRWSRIAQREHYIPGSVIKFYIRWVKLKRLNFLIILLLILSIFLSLMYELASVMLIATGLIFPYGIGYRATTSKIDITPRLKRLFIVYMLFVTLLTTLFLFTGLGYFGAMASFLFSFFFFDRSLKLMFNIEKRLTSTFVDNAKEQINKLSGPVVGITGSYSKTTTKEVLTEILSKQNNVFATPNSYNNRLGIAKAINDSDLSKAEMAIIEMGTYGPGEIKDICAWVRPHVAVITGIGPVHLERMKTYENILDAKSEIVDLAGSVVINGDDKMLLDKARSWLPNKQVIDCSIESNHALVFVNYESGIHSIYIEGLKIGEIQAPEVHQLSIALSIGVLYVLDLDIHSLIQAVPKLSSVKHRQSILEGKKQQKIIDNTFNSNPYSVLSSLKLLEETAVEESKLWLVTPGMVELGSEQFALNVAFAEEASKIVDGVFIIGLTNKRALKLGFIDSEVEIYFAEKREDAVKKLDSFVKENDVVLFENDLPDHYP